MSSPVAVTHHDTHTLITMDDGKANALGFAMLEGLDSALSEAESAGKVVVLAGRPGKFCAGFDLSIMGQGGPEQARLLRAGADLSLRMVKFPLPVVLAVTGHALAMGALVCLSADYRVGVEGPFKLGLNEVAIGMTLPWFGVELARDRLTRNAFNPAVNLAQIYNPEDAVAAGYLDAVVEPDAFMPHVEAVAAGLGQLNMTAHAETKLRTRAAFIDAVDTAFARDFGGLAPVQSAPAGLP